MTFRSHLSHLVERVQAVVGSNSTRQTSHSEPDAPEVPIASKPGGGTQIASASSGISTPYWQPHLDPHHSTVPEVFHYELGQHGWGNAEAQNYVSSPANSFLSPEGVLVVRAIADLSRSSKAERYTSARLSSHQTFGRPRGRLSGMIDMPIASGIWPAFWLLPCEPFVWPTDGEIDIMETWNGDAVNHSCLHWGFHNSRDKDKHRARETKLSPDRPGRACARFDFTWDEDEASGQGRLLWYIDGKPVMRAMKPPNTRMMRDFRIIINIAMGGEVCQGQLPAAGVYEMQVKDLGMWDAPERGWAAFEKDWKNAKDGHSN